MNCPFKKITVKEEDIANHKTLITEKFGDCDTYNCVAYHPHGLPVSPCTLCIPNSK